MIKPETHQMIMVLNAITDVHALMWASMHGTTPDIADPLPKAFAARIAEKSLAIYNQGITWQALRQLLREELALILEMEAAK